MSQIFKLAKHTRHLKMLTRTLTIERSLITSSSLHTIVKPLTQTTNTRTIHTNSVLKSQLEAGAEPLKDLFASTNPTNQLAITASSQQFKNMYEFEILMKRMQSLTTNDLLVDVELLDSALKKLKKIDFNVNHIKYLLDVTASIPTLRPSDRLSRLNSLWNLLDERKQQLLNQYDVQLYLTYIKNLFNIISLDKENLRLNYDLVTQINEFIKEMNEKKLQITQFLTEYQFSAYCLYTAYDEDIMNDDIKPHKHLISIQTTLNMLSTLKNQSLTISNKTFNSLIMAYLNLKQDNEVFNIYELMKKRNLTPNTKTLSLILKYYLVEKCDIDKCEFYYKKLFNEDKIYLTQRLMCDSVLEFLYYYENKIDKNNMICDAKGEFKPISYFLESFINMHFSIFNEEYVSNYLFDHFHKACLTSPNQALRLYSVDWLINASNHNKSVKESKISRARDLNDQQDDTQLLKDEEADIVKQASKIIDNNKKSFDILDYDLENKDIYNITNSFFEHHYGYTLSRLDFNHQLEIISKLNEKNLNNEIFSVAQYQRILYLLFINLYSNQKQVDDSFKQAITIFEAIANDNYKNLNKLFNKMNYFVPLLIQSLNNNDVESLGRVLTLLTKKFNFDMQQLQVLQDTMVYSFDKIASKLNNENLLKIYYYLHKYPNVEAIKSLNDIKLDDITNNLPNEAYLSMFNNDSYKINYIRTAIYAPRFRILITNIGKLLYQLPNYSFDDYKIALDRLYLNSNDPNSVKTLYNVFDYILNKSNYEFKQTFVNATINTPFESAITNLLNQFENKFKKVINSTFSINNAGKSFDESIKLIENNDEFKKIDHLFKFYLKFYSSYVNDNPNTTSFVNLRFSLVQTLEAIVKLELGESIDHVHKKAFILKYYLDSITMYDIKLFMVRSKLDNLKNLIEKNKELSEFKYHFVIDDRFFSKISDKLKSIAYNARDNYREIVENTLYKTNLLQICDDNKVSLENKEFLRSYLDKLQASANDLVQLLNKLTSLKSYRFDLQEYLLMILLTGNRLVTHLTKHKDEYKFNEDLSNKFANNDTNIEVLAKKLTDAQFKMLPDTYRLLLDNYILINNNNKLDQNKFNYVLDIYNHLKQNYAQAIDDKLDMKYKNAFLNCLLINENIKMTNIHDESLIKELYRNAFESINNSLDTSKLNLNNYYSIACAGSKIATRTAYIYYEKYKKSNANMYLIDTLMFKHNNFDMAFDYYKLISNKNQTLNNDNNLIKSDTKQHNNDYIHLIMLQYLVKTNNYEKLKEFIDNLTSNYDLNLIINDFLTILLFNNLNDKVTYLLKQYSNIFKYDQQRLNNTFFILTNYFDINIGQENSQEITENKSKKHDFSISIKNIENYFDYLSVKKSSLDETNIESIEALKEFSLNDSYFYFFNHLINKKNAKSELIDALLKKYKSRIGKNNINLFDEQRPKDLKQFCQYYEKYLLYYNLGETKELDFLKNHRKIEFLRLPIDEQFKYHYLKYKNFDSLKLKQDYLIKLALETDTNPANLNVIELFQKLQSDTSIEELNYARFQLALAYSKRGMYDELVKNVIEKDSPQYLAQYFEAVKLNSKNKNENITNDETESTTIESKNVESEKNKNNYSADELLYFNTLEKALAASILNSSAQNANAISNLYKKNVNKFYLHEKITLAKALSRYSLIQGKYQDYANLVRKNKLFQRKLFIMDIVQDDIEKLNVS